MPGMDTLPCGTTGPNTQLRRPALGSAPSAPAPQPLPPAVCLPRPAGGLPLPRPPGMWCSETLRASSALQLSPEHRKLRCRQHEGLPRHSLTHPAVPGSPSLRKTSGSQPGPQSREPTAPFRAGPCGGSLPTAPCFSRTTTACSPHIQTAGPPLARESLLLGGQVRPAFHLSPCFSRLRCLANHRRVGSFGTHLLPHSLCGPGAWYNLTGSCAQGWAGLCSPLVAVVGRILVSVIIGLRSQGCSPLLEATLSPCPRAT